jgi:acetyl esterase/lipase
MPSLQVLFVEKFIKLTKSKTFLNRNNLSAIRKADYKQPLKFIYPSVSIVAESIDGVPCFHLIPPKSNKDTVILYFHGGAFVSGPQIFHWIMLKKLALETKIPILFVNYGKAPENPFPGAINDTYKTYMHLLSKNPNAKIIIGGDSAGGTLTLALTFKLKENNIPLPYKLLLLAPCADCRFSNPYIDVIGKKDVMLDKEGLIYITKEWYAPNIDDTNPYISPIFGDTTGFPKSILMIGTHDILHPDCILLYNKMKTQGVNIQLIEGKEMFHDWMVAPTFIPESKTALNQLINFILTE